MVSEAVKRPHVLIVGAGLGGLTLAQALRKQGVSFEIFERDASKHSRFQGWAIALHAILPDLRASLPEDLPPVEVTNHLLPLKESAGFTMYMDDGERLDMGDSVKPSLRANRQRLRDWLAIDVNIQWGKHIRSIEEIDNIVKLQFEDGTTASGDVLVGADGVHSQVRHHLFDGKDQLNTLPVASIIGEPTLNQEQYKRQLELGRSVWIVRHPDYRFFVGLNRVANDASKAYYYWVWAWVTQNGTEKDATWTQSMSKQELWDYIMLRLDKLDPKYQEIIKLTKPEDMHTPTIVFRDMILDDMPNRRITLLGDAAHPMTPYRGEGGNHAMQDSLNLARALSKASPDTVKEELKAYQDEMLVRGSEAVKKSRIAAFDDGSSTRASWRENLGVNA